ncbi:hypothetical protein GE118_00120 [Mycoplasma sp. NEAQ87857]|uniref:MYPU_1760 family metalloprotease n=1 Tax=Mycoplasma sp. NEAQ87857 TaxID=2683967 RepID=UPI00131887E7|nr:hypothetical protein [Mycoplasma sp. NEAQ87857]QGZ97208.1 hypothetical protein GE118_00120 [Mycoplasma sp. NEAQ87857]
MKTKSIFAILCILGTSSLIACHASNNQAITKPIKKVDDPLKNQQDPSKNKKNENNIDPNKDKKDKNSNDPNKKDENNVDPNKDKNANDPSKNKKDENNEGSNKKQDPLNNNENKNNEDENSQKPNTNNPTDKKPGDEPNNDNKSDLNNGENNNPLNKKDDNKKETDNLNNNEGNNNPSNDNKQNENKTDTNINKDKNNNNKTNIESPNTDLNSDKKDETDKTSSGLEKNSDNNLNNHNTDNTHSNNNTNETNKKQDETNKTDTNTEGKGDEKNNNVGNNESSNTDLNDKKDEPEKVDKTDTGTNDNTDSLSADKDNHPIEPENKPLEPSGSNEPNHPNESIDHKDENNEIDNKNDDSTNINNNALEVVINNPDHLQPKITYDNARNTEGLLVPDIIDRDQPENYRLQRYPISKEEMSLVSLDHNDELNFLNKFNNDNNDVVHKTNSYGQSYYEYQDPFTKIIFRDYAYGNGKYILGPDNIKLLAQEFKRKIPFGPEVYDLEAVNINDFKVIDSKASGLYFPTSKNIFINTQSVIGTDFKNYDVIATIMPTLFHEYIHHWAFSYAQIALPFVAITKNDLPAYFKDDILGSSEIIYKPNVVSGYDRQYWNKYFTDNLVHLLNFDFDKKAALSSAIFGIWPRLNNQEIWNRFLHNNLTPKQIWDLANHNKSIDTDYNTFFYEAGLTFNLPKKNIPYYYSLTELMPREYTKFAYESYYNINEKRTNKFIASNGFGYSTISWFGINKYNSNNIRQSIIPSSNSDDWSRTYLNTESSPYRQGNYIQNALTFPNTVFKIDDYKFFDENGAEQTLDESRSKNRSIEFYKLFLETMGYGKTISQVFYQNKWSFLYARNKEKKGAPVADGETANNVKLAGYLPNTKYTGFAFVKDGKIYNQTKFDYSPAFNFFGHYQFDQGARLLENNQLSNDRLNQIGNRLYPKNKYYTYITDTYIKIHDLTQVKMWIDKNHDGIAQEDELDNNYKFKLPEHRYVTTARSGNPMDSKFRPIVALKDKNNENGVVFETIVGPSNNN